LFEAVSFYRARISGPLLDRIDLYVDVLWISSELLHSKKHRGESSAVIRERVIAVRRLQTDRAGKPNAFMEAAEVERFCPLSKKDRQMLHQACEKLQLSARAHNRIIKIARTITDMDGRVRINDFHWIILVR
jgi:magnesium chelatase family protein